ncbi:MAG: hypothetical protein FJ317_07280 [SAR202 cluster bacterium]|nr:hypothetical protein [SAR202 cluster bacterium]
MLRKLYVKQSLRNAGGGIEFDLKNGLGSGYAYKMQPVELDGIQAPLESTTFTLEGGAEVKFSDVSKENTFTLAMNKTLTIRVAGHTLTPGPHKIGMGFDVPGLGTLRFDFTDTVK